LDLHIPFRLRPMSTTKNMKNHAHKGLRVRDTAAKTIDSSSTVLFIATGAPITDI